MPHPGGYRDPVARGILSSLLRLIRPSRTSAAPGRTARHQGEEAPGRDGSTATLEVAAPPKSALRITYAPDHDADTVYAVKLTSKAHDGQRDFLPIGPGPWDSQGRPSWVDVDQFYLVHKDGMRREAAALDLDRFTRVAAELTRRYGWEVGDPR